MHDASGPAVDAATTLHAAVPIGFETRRIDPVRKIAGLAWLLRTTQSVLRAFEAPDAGFRDND